MYQTAYKSAYDEGIEKDLSPLIEIPVAGNYGKYYHQ
jgi:hypothetical protein